MSGSGDESDPDSLDNCFSLLKIAENNDVEQLTKLISLHKSISEDIGINQRDDRYKTALIVAAEKNRGSSHYELVEMLLNNGADPNAKGLDEKTPLWYFLDRGNLEMLKLFLRFNPDLKNVDYCESSVLIPAVQNRDYLDVLKYLVQDLGFDVNHRDKHGWTCLHEAAFYNEIDSNFEKLKFLLESGADPNARNIGGFTPFWISIEDMNFKVFELFLKHNADVYTVSGEGQNILFKFYDSNSNVKVLNKSIHDFGLDVNLKDAHESTPLHSIFDSLEFEPINFRVIKSLLVNGANINAPDENGDTPFYNLLRRISQDDKYIERIDFDFFIEQIDFSVVHNNAHTFKYHGPYYSEYLSTLILEHLAKLEFLSIPIHPVVTEFINNQNDYKKYFDKCTEELKVMSCTKPQNSWITFFDLLVDGRRKLKNYAGNKDLIQDCQKNDRLKIFPIYGASLEKNVEKGLERRKLFDKSCILLSDCLPIFKPNHLVVKDIFDCILSKKDLSNFCE